MTAYEKYTFFLCLIVFVALTAVFSTLLTYVVRLTVRLIKHGAEDERILKEYHKNKGQKKQATVMDRITRIFSIVVCLAMLCVFAFAVFVRVNEKDFSNQVSTLRVVRSSSMSHKYERNRYLFKNNLDDQIQMLDLIVTEPLPGEFELQLYDIVVYEQNEKLIIHRIVDIEEPNEYHPNERFFRLQGDAVETSDRFPVHYTQMRAIYRGERIPFLGSFVAFMQSPAGYLCILLVLFAILVLPLVEKKLLREQSERLHLLLGDDEYRNAVLTEIEYQKLLRKSQKNRLRAPVIDTHVQFDVKSLNVSVEDKKGRLFWLRFGFANQKGPDLDSILQEKRKK